MGNDIPHTPRSANPYAIQSFDQLRVIYPDVENALANKQTMLHFNLAPSLSSDTVREQRCPKCRRIDTVVYNGNYWCSRCPWVMGEDGRPKRIVIAYLRQCHQECTQRGDAAGAKRMEFYLDNHGAPVSTSKDDGTDSKPVDQEG